jgi:regulator of protease activity HflC (stomatin/prohibitin superfamily)
MELYLVWLVVGIVLAIRVVAEANAAAIRAVAESLAAAGGMDAANLKVAEEYITAFANLAKTNNTLILPSNLSDVAGLIGTAMTVLDRTKGGGAGAAAMPRA